MTELLKSSYRLSMAYSILFIIIGILLFVDPAGFVVLVSYLIGILLLVTGTNNIISYSKNRDLAASKVLLVLGVILFIMGTFLIARPTFIGKIVPSIIGICLIINSLEKLLYLNYLTEKSSDSYIIYSVMDLIEKFRFKKGFKNIKKKDEENIKVIDER